MCYDVYKPNSDHYLLAFHLGGEILFHIQKYIGSYMGILSLNGYALDSANTDLCSPYRRVYIGRSH